MYLCQTANITLNHTFENAVVKLLSSSDDNLENDEKEAAEKLKKNNQRVEAVDNEKDDFSQTIIKKRRQSIHAESRYVICKYILPTANLVERFFSTAGYVYSYLRQPISPSNLKFNFFSKLTTTTTTKRLYSPYRRQKYKYRELQKNRTDRVN